jgi:ABC-type phosphate transport system substrate-binding protein
MTRTNQALPSRALRAVAALLGVTMLVSGVALFVATPVRAQVARQLSVEPSTGLVNEVVRVSWQGFTPTAQSGDHSVIVMQCSANPTSLDDCFRGEPFPAIPEGTILIGKTGTDGTGSVLFEVRPAANLPALDCSAQAPCSILAFENFGQPVPPDGLPETSVTAPLTFARSRADCPEITGFDVRADGEASAASVFYGWAAQRCQGNDPLILDYTETSSNAGRENFLRGLVDLGVTTLPATQAELDVWPDHRDYAYGPIDLTAIVVVVNMKDPFTGRRLDNIVLSPRLVTRLITDSDVASFLGDPELRQLNPGVRFPTNSLSHPLLRGEGNADTRLVTTWTRSSKDARDFVAGNDRFGLPVNPAYRDFEYPVDIFENVAQSSQFLPRQGQRNVALRVFYGVRPAGSISEPTDQVGFLGIVDLGTARRFGLPTARIKNAAGVAVAPTDEAVMAGYAAMQRTSAGTLVADVATSDPDAYPLVKVDYAMVPKKVEVADSVPAQARAKSEKRASDIRAFLTFAAGAGQDALPAGYLPLPDELRAETRAVAAAVRGPDAPTTTTTAPTTPTTLPFDPNAGGSDTGYVAYGDDFTSGSGDGTSTGTGTTPEGDAATEIASGRVKLASLRTVTDHLTLPALLALGGLALLGWAVSGATHNLRRRGPRAIASTPAPSGGSPPRSAPTP